VRKRRAGTQREGAPLAGHAIRKPELLTQLGVQQWHDTSTQKYRRWSEFYRPRGPWLAVLVVAPIPPGGWGTRTTFSYLGKCPGDDVLDL
jgi:hypothetical protein